MVSSRKIEELGRVESIFLTNIYVPSLTKYLFGVAIGSVFVMNLGGTKDQ